MNVSNPISHVISSYIHTKEDLQKKSTKSCIHLHEEICTTSRRIASEQYGGGAPGFLIKKIGVPDSRVRVHRYVRCGYQKCPAD